MHEGVLRQDFSFALEGLSGRSVVEVIGVVDLTAADDQPWIVNMKLDDEVWHRFYLEVGIGFAVWEQWARLVDDDPDGDAVRHVNYGTAFGLVGDAILSIEARPRGPIGLSEVTIRFKSERLLRLTFEDENDPDSPPKLTVSTAR